METEGLTIRDMWAMARQMLDTDEADNREIRAAVLILSTGLAGTNVRRLHAFTGIPMSDVQRVSYNLRRGRIWQGRVFYAPWLEEDAEPGSWPIAFILQVLVATGDIIARGPDAYLVRTVDTEFSIDGADIPWRDIVPRRTLRRHGAERDQREPFWVRREPSTRPA